MSEFIFSEPPPKGIKGIHITDANYGNSTKISFPGATVLVKRPHDHFIIEFGIYTVRVAATKEPDISLGGL